MRHSKAQNASYSRGTIWIKRGRSRKTPPQPWLGREDIQYCVTAHWYYKSLLHKNMNLTVLSAKWRAVWPTGVFYRPSGEWFGRQACSTGQIESGSPDRGVLPVK